MRKLLLLILLCIVILPAQSFEDCVISNDGKLTDIRIEHNDVIDVYPIYTIMNEKNILYVEPLKFGKTKFSVIKNNKRKVVFDVEVNEESTNISEVSGFEIMTIDVIDNPSTEEEYFELDLPPELGE